MTDESAEFCETNATQPRDIIPPAVKGGKENAMAEFFACIRENRRPFADVQVGATAALTTIMGREAIYSGRSVTWDELGYSLVRTAEGVFPTPGFVSLMPKRHFRALDGDSSASIWRVVGDEIVCQGKPNGFLRSKKSYRNYVLRAEWRFRKKAGRPRNDEGWPNAGFFIHAHEPSRLSQRVRGAGALRRSRQSVWRFRRTIKGAKRGVIVKIGHCSETGTDMRLPVGTVK